MKFYAKLGDFYVINWWRLDKISANLKKKIMKPVSIPLEQNVFGETLDCASTELSIFTRSSSVQIFLEMKIHL